MSTKDATIVVHTGENAKNFVKWAAKCRGQSMNSFMLYASLSEAERVLQRVFADWDGKYERIENVTTIETVETATENQPE